MPIVAAFMVPHPPMIVPEVGRGSEKQVEKTIKAYEKVADVVLSGVTDAAYIAKTITEIVEDSNGNTVDFGSGITYWVHHDITDKMASLYIIKYEGGNYTVLTGSTYKNYVNYVIPVSYF